MELICIFCVSYLQNSLRHEKLQSKYLPPLIIIMIKNSNWGQNTLKSTHKKAHTKPIISISPFDNNTFFTSSEDNTLRLWDLRLHSSVKLFRNESLHNLTNCDNDKKMNIFVGNTDIVICFDIRRQNIFVEEIKCRSQQAHFDELSVIKVDCQDGVLAAGDDQGDARLYNYGLQCVGLLDQGHRNIVNTIEFMNGDKGRICLTGGFDSKIIHWNSENGKIIREVDMHELLLKSQIKISTPPFIYCIHVHKSTIYVTTESGHVVAFPCKEPRKPKYILEASMSKVVQLRVPGFNQNLFASLSYYDGAISIFDHTKRVDGCPLFLQKYKCLQHPIWLQTIGNNILVSYNGTSDLTFLEIK